MFPHMIINCLISHCRSHLYFFITYFTDNKPVGWHMFSISSFGEKGKTKNRNIKPSNALQGHYWLLSSIFDNILCFISSRSCRDRLIPVSISVIEMARSTKSLLIDFLYNPLHKMFPTSYKVYKANRISLHRTYRQVRNLYDHYSVRTYLKNNEQVSHKGLQTI